MSLLTEPLLTERLSLRILAPEEAEILQAYLLANRNHLAHWEPLRTEEYFSLEQCRQRLVSSYLNMEAGSALHLAVFITGSRHMIGICHFSNIVRGLFQACHLGYAIAEKYQGQA